MAKRLPECEKTLCAFGRLVPLKFGGTGKFEPHNSGQTSATFCQSCPQTAVEPNANDWPSTRKSASLVCESNQTALKDSQKFLTK